MSEKPRREGQAECRIVCRGGNLDPAGHSEQKAGPQNRFRVADGTRRGSPTAIRQRVLTMARAGILFVGAEWPVFAPEQISAAYRS